MMIFNRVYSPSETYTIPLSCEILSVMADGEITEDYVLENNTLTLDNNNISNLTISLKTFKQSIAGYSDKSVYKFFGEDEVLEYNSTYDIELLDNLKITFDTTYSPLYCKVKDVERLINPVLKYLDISNEEVEYEIFVTSKDVLNDLFDNDESELSDDDFNYRNLAKLVSNKVALDLMYKYYYTIIDQIGVHEQRVGTLSESIEKKEIVLKDLIDRFDNNIKRLEESFKNPVIAVAFTKAKDASTGLNSRTWGDGSSDN